MTHALPSYHIGHPYQSWLFAIQMKAQPQLSILRYMLLHCARLADLAGRYEAHPQQLPEAKACHTPERDFGSRYKASPRPDARYRRQKRMRHLHLMLIQSKQSSVDRWHGRSQRLRSCFIPDSDVSLPNSCQLGSNDATGGLAGPPKPSSYYGRPACTDDDETAHT